MGYISYYIYIYVYTYIYIYIGVLSKIIFYLLQDGCSWKLESSQGTDDMYMGMLSGGLAGMSRQWWDESGGRSVCGPTMVLWGHQ